MDSAQYISGMERVFVSGKQQGTERTDSENRG